MPGQCYELEDGSSSFKDFHGSRNNRFTSPEQAAKNRIQHPSNVLHFFNAQPDVTPEIFSQVRAKTSRQPPLEESARFSCRVSLQICEDIGVKCPANVKLFTGKSKMLSLERKRDP